MTAGPLTYVYAVARHSVALAQATHAVEGVTGSPVHLVPPARDSALVAVASPVPEDDFREAALRRHLEDLAWLEALARAHHHVVEATAAHSTVLPLRLATVYLDDDRVRAMLDDRHDLLLGTLEQLDGHVELGVKIYLDVASGTAPASAPAPDPTLSPGRAYLRHRRAEQDIRDAARQAAEEAAGRIEAIARTHAVQRARHRIQEGELATGPGTNVSNDAYLVPAAHADAFRIEATHATDGLTGVHVDVTGPWAPYSFATLPDPDEDAP
ncbi:gas vesicle protein [Kitasatospora indigofera]|uniref:Gas vesicle protein n=1 Tax=Kitasatospora indigofera TaxID=67307 RepID=A0A919L312_9ACTN|nr:GvpL/GvpF family gas vesicle protein [Kitasatospora indigofera]GHH82062.1 gas vesicle protein [Kitasatospora indigofera]